MHGLRSAILSGEAASTTLVTSKERCRRQSEGGSLTGLRIPREERRNTDQRREDRHWGVVDRAMIVFRRKKLLVRVVNVSPGGIMIEADIVPRIGEGLAVQFDGFEGLQGIVRWVKQGRIGLDLGDGSIDVG